MQGGENFTLHDDIRINIDKMTFQYISVYLTVLLPQFLITESQFMPPGAFPFPPPGGMQIPGMPAMPMLQNMPMPGQMAYPMPQSRPPMAAMPFYSKSGRKHVPKYMKRSKRKHFRRKNHFDDSNSSGDASDNSDSKEFTYRSAKRNGKPKSQRRQVLTPVVSYVTKEGYVIYQKKIKKDRAKDWLEMEKSQQPLNDDREQDESPESYKEEKRRHRLPKKSSNDY